MIKPTVGRVVWFHHGPEHKLIGQPMAAIITSVQNDRTVNLSVFSHGGNQFGRTSVLLLQGDETYKPMGPFCEWMPYQVGQAKKDEKAQFLNPALGEPFTDTAPTLTSITSKIGDVSHTETKFYGEVGSINIHGDPPVGAVKPTSIPLTPHEIQCGSTRVDWAEGLIRQLPETHDGRNSWLLNFGRDRVERQAAWVERNPNSSLARTQDVKPAEPETALPDDGTDAAVALCQHLDRVGRTSSERTITVNGGTFNVQAKLVYRNPAAPDTLPEASPATKGQCNDERSCGACFSGQGTCNAPDTRPKTAPEAATSGETVTDKQTAHQLPPEYVEIRKGYGGVGIEASDKWVRCKVECSRDWLRKHLVVRDGMALRAVEIGQYCRRADAPGTVPDPIEAEIQAKGLTAPRVTKADIEAEISAEYSTTAASAFKDCPLVGSMEQITIYVLIMRNGTKIVGANTGPVSPENFDADLGRKLAREDALRQVWPLIGYALRDRLAGGAA